jgi:methylated-DNA-[protein]-cysteine S-methyltransferase
VIAYYGTFSTPVGRFSVAVDGDERVLAAAFGDAAALGRLPTAADVVESREHIEHVRRQVEEYFSGARQTFDLELAPAGTPFQQACWSLLVQVPFGSTISYSELAARAGSSPRAAGRANATNPVCLIVPCHRVIGADGSLTGYAYGLEVKRRLLDFEREAMARPD